MTSPQEDDAVVAHKASNKKDSEISVELLSYDSKWLLQISKTIERELFIGHNVFQWNSYVERILKPRNLMHHLLEEGPVATDSKYFYGVNVDSILFSW